MVIGLEMKKRESTVDESANIHLNCTDNYDELK